MSNHYMAVYGTLRKDQPFFDGLMDVTYLRTVQLPGYDMYSMGYCPIIVPADTDHEITVDVLRMGDQDFETIQRVETGAGYDPQLVQDMAENNEHIVIWVAHNPESIKKRLSLVKSGDWVEHIGAELR